MDWSRDGSRSLWFVNLKQDEGTQRFTPIVRDPDGSFHVAGVTQNDIGSGIDVEPTGTSADLGAVLQATFTRPPLTDGTTDGRSPTLRSLYASTRGPDGLLRTRQVAYRAGATMFPTCEISLGGANVTARHAVSDDGQKIFFTASCGDASAQRVWVKIGDHDPVDLSESQCQATCGPERVATFRGASRDGSRVYFTTEQRLVPEDEDTSGQSDLYEYDFNASGQKLRLVTGGPAAAGANARFVRRVSNDGAYVYFVASGRALASANGRGVSPQPGDNNLYVYHRPSGQANGTIAFVGALDLNDNPLVQASASGRFLLLQSTQDLTGERLAGDSHPDLYRYDAEGDELLRVWSDDPLHNGTARVDGAVVSGAPEVAPGGGMQKASGWYRSLQLSDDGLKVGFATLEPLSRDDRNSSTDAYLWHAGSGKITMLTDGTSAPTNRLVGSQFFGMTPSGDSLFVSSASRLLKQHTSGQLAAYVIRSGGGFPAPADPSETCVGDRCQGPKPPPPGPFDLPSSSRFSGPGNAVPAPERPSTTIRISKVKAVHGTSTKVKVRVPGKGKLRVSGRGLKRSTRSAGKAGSYRVSVTLSKRSRSTLRGKGRVKVRVSVRFVPENGRSVTKRVSVTFKSKTTKQNPKASSRSGQESSALSLDAQKGR